MTLTRPKKPMLDFAFEDLPGADRVLGKKVAIVTSSIDTDITYVPSEVLHFRRKMLIEAAGIVFVTWQVDYRHRGIDAGSGFGTQYPVGLAGYALYRRAATEGGLTGSFLVVNRTTGAGQILGVSHHYTTCGVARIPFAVEGGYWYEWSLALGGHTDAGTMSGVDGAVEVCPNGGVNYLLLEYEPGATLLP